MHCSAGGKRRKILFAVSVSVPSFRYDSKKMLTVKNELKKLKLKLELLLRNYNGDILI